MKLEDRLLADDLQDEIEDLEEDINNIQTAIFRLQDVRNDNFGGTVADCIEELEAHIKTLEKWKAEDEERRSKLNEY